MLLLTSSASAQSADLQEECKRFGYVVATDQLGETARGSREWKALRNAVFRECVQRGGPPPSATEEAEQAGPPIDGGPDQNPNDSGQGNQGLGAGAGTGGLGGTAGAGSGGLGQACVAAASEFMAARAADYGQSPTHPAWAVLTAKLAEICQAKGGWANRRAGTSGSCANYARYYADALSGQISGPEWTAYHRAASMACLTLDGPWGGSAALSLPHAIDGFPDCCRGVTGVNPREIQTRCVAYGYGIAEQLAAFPVDYLRALPRDAASLIGACIEAGGPGTRPYGLNYAPWYDTVPPPPPPPTGGGAGAGDRPGEGGEPYGDDSTPQGVITELTPELYDGPWPGDCAAYAQLFADEALTPGGDSGATPTRQQLVNRATQKCEAQGFIANPVHLLDECSSTLRRCGYARGNGYSGSGAELPEFIVIIIENTVLSTLSLDDALAVLELVDDCAGPAIDAGMLYGEPEEGGQLWFDAAAGSFLGCLTAPPGGDKFGQPGTIPITVLNIIASSAQEVINVFSQFPDSSNITSTGPSDFEWTLQHLFVLLVISVSGANETDEPPGEDESPQDCEKAGGGGDEDCLPGEKEGNELAAGCIDDVRHFGNNGNWLGSLAEGIANAYCGSGQGDQAEQRAREAGYGGAVDRVFGDGGYKCANRCDDIFDGGEANNNCRAEVERVYRSLIDGSTPTGGSAFASNQMMGAYELPGALESCTSGVDGCDSYEAASTCEPIVSRFCLDHRYQSQSEDACLTLTALICTSELTSRANWERRNGQRSCY